MAGKGKKSKRREKRRKNHEAASPETAADGAGVPADEEADETEADQPAHEVGANQPADAAEANRPADGAGGDTDEGDVASGRPVAAVIEVDDELEDPDVRADLIAAAAGLAEVEGTEGGGAEVEATGDAPAEDVEAPAEGSDEGGEKAEPAGEADGDEAKPSGEAGDEAKPSDEANGDRGSGEDGERPLIGRDALIALTQFRDEGVATVPEELVLDLGEATSPEERDRLLAAALAHVEMQEAIYRVPTESTTTRHWKGLIAAGVFILAAFLAVLPPDPLVPAGPEPLSDADRLRGIRTALLVQAEQIEAFRVREDRLPASLGEVDTALPDMRFVRSGNRLYQLVAYTRGGDAVIYDSAAPDSAFADIGSPLLPEDAS